MPDAVEVLVPLLNPNEREALVTGVHVAEGDRIGAGDLLCTLETTKSTADVVAAQEGYVIGFSVTLGQVLVAGQRLCWLAQDRDWQAPERPETPEVEVARAPKGLRITQPALELASELGLDLAALPVGPLVTRGMVQELAPSEHAYDLPSGPYAANALLIYGGGGHGKSLIDLIRVHERYEILGVIDDGLGAGTKIMGVPVLGGGRALEDLYEHGLRLAVNAVGGVGDIMSRVHIFERLIQVGFECPALVHPMAFIEPSATLDQGVQVLPHAYIGSEVHLAFGAIVNTGAVVSHDCTIGQYANIAPGALLAGGVSVGARALIGMGVTVNLDVSIGESARVGNSAVIKQDVPRGGIIRAGAVWPEV